MNYSYISKCRVCEKNNFIKYLNLGSQPASNSFLNKFTEKEHKYPLEVLLCRNCGLSQLSVVVNSKEIFSDYDYLSSNSKQLVLHYKKLTEKLVSKFRLTSKDLILDIGCNDGVLLNNYPSNSYFNATTASSSITLYNYSQKIESKLNDFNKKIFTRFINGPQLIFHTRSKQNDQSSQLHNQLRSVQRFHYWKFHIFCAI